MRNLASVESVQGGEMTLDILAVSVLVLIDVILIVIWRNTDHPFIERTKND